MSSCFEAKVALVSGASRGVGLALARHLAARGAAVVISARGGDRLEKARRELEETGARVEAVVGDVGRMEDAAAMVQAAIDRFGGLDVVVNNAGVSMRGDFAELDPKVCRDVLVTNLEGSVYLTRAAVAAVSARRGSIVFVSSVAGLFGVPGASVYSASKGGLTGFAESLRIELAGAGVHVGVVHLGFTEHDPEKRIIAADGSLVAPDRPAHHTQAYAAGQIARLIERRRRRVVMGLPGKLGWVVHGISPGLYERAVIAARAADLGVYRRFS